jgi:phosphoethanolamine N-methyltransferase
VVQYSQAFVDALQFAWGEGFLSPGGPDEVAALLAGETLAGKRVLDIGSGVGGIDALLVASHHAAEVVGIDVEPLLIANARALIDRRGLAGQVSFRPVEPGPLPFADVTFDVVFSKDAIVHIPDKAALYREALRVLRQGGRFLASDWLFAKGAETSPAILAWLAGGPLTFAYVTPEEALEALAQAGFEEAAIVDRSATIRALNRAELGVLEGPARQRLAALVGTEMAEQRLHSARGRQAVLDRGVLRPCHLKGRKPA